MSQPPSQPLNEVEVCGARITLLGTAHVSRESAEEVERLLEDGGYDAVAIELCPSRHHALLDPDSLSRMDLMQVIREGKVPMVTMNLALGAFQQRLADQFGIRPGEEMRRAIEIGQRHHLPVLLIDREIGVTLKRVVANLPWWKRLFMFSGLLASVVVHEDVSEEEIERLKEGDVLESTFAQFAEHEPRLHEPLIAERDRYMAARLMQEARQHPGERILAVVGAGHLAGITRALEAHRHDCDDAQYDPARELEALEQVPDRRSLWRLFPWLVVGLVLLGFWLGFQRSPELGWRLVADWVLINGTLSALGALLAAAHPLTVLTAFLAAPITSLNPTIGAGMVAAAVELWLRKPTVGDFARLRQDTTRLSGWWRNRVSRLFLVFILSSLGSAIGTYVAGFRIFDRLTG